MVNLQKSWYTLLSVPKLTIAIHYFTDCLRIRYTSYTAARIVTLTRKYDRFTPVLQSLHWLPVKYRIIFKILLLVYKSLNGLAPTHIADLFSYKKYTRALRSASQSFLQITRMNSKSYGDRAFSVSGPKLLNGLPLKYEGLVTLTVLRQP